MLWISDNIYKNIMSSYPTSSSMGKFDETSWKKPKAFLKSGVDCRICRKGDRRQVTDVNVNRRKSRRSEATRDKCFERKLRGYERNAEVLHWREHGVEFVEVRSTNRQPVAPGARYPRYGAVPKCTECSRTSFGCRLPIQCTYSIGKHVYLLESGNALKLISADQTPTSFIGGKLRSSSRGLPPLWRFIFLKIQQSNIFIINNINSVVMWVQTSKLYVALYF